MAIKTLVKSLGAGLLHASGALAMGRPPITFLGYHRVLDGPIERVTDCPWGMVVSRDMFVRQLEYVARRYRLVSLEDIEQACEGRRPLPRRACFVTFDDGWEDNYRVAFPILRRLGVPAAIFVTTGYVGTTRRFWYVPLIRALTTSARISPGAGRDAGLDGVLAAEVDRLAALSRRLSPPDVDRLVGLLKTYPDSVVEGAVDALVRRLDGVPASAEPTTDFVTWDQLREMDRVGVRAGSHTCTHRILTHLDDADAAAEMRRSREQLEAELGRRTIAFAPPNGDYRPAHLRLASEAGYRLFFANETAAFADRPLAVFPRACVHDAVGRGPDGRFAPSLLELHLSGWMVRARGWLPA